MHDYDGNKDHQQLGSGLLNFKEELLYATKNDIDVLIEVKQEEELKNSVDILKDFI